MKDGYGNKSKGTNASPAINAYARSRLRSWLLAPVPIMQTIDGEEKEVMVPRLFTVRNRALLKELINYNSEGNFDRISAMGMLMLLREDRMIRYQGDVSKESRRGLITAMMVMTHSSREIMTLDLGSKFSKNGD